MDLYNIFKSFFGIPNSIPPPDLRYDEVHPDQRDEIVRPSSLHTEDETLWSSFMSDPQEFQNFVEEQMQQIMSSFGFSSAGTQFGESFALTPEAHAPLSLREQFLKPGYDHPSSNKADTDLDGKVNLDELETVLKPAPEPHPQSVRPTFKTHTFGQSVRTRTVALPDGTVETTRTVKDNKGNQETTVTRQDQDTQYTITTSITADGVETKEEQFVNLAEGARPPPMRDHRWPSWLELFVRH